MRVNKIFNIWFFIGSGFLPNPMSTAEGRESKEEFFLLFGGMLCNLVDIVNQVECFTISINHVDREVSPSPGQLSPMLMLWFPGFTFLLTWCVNISPSGDLTVLTVTLQYTISLVKLTYVECVSREIFIWGGREGGEEGPYGSFSRLGLRWRLVCHKCPSRSSQDLLAVSSRISQG